MYIISSCLLGNNCKYDGGNNFNNDVVDFYKTHNCCVVCPEVFGGLSTPRIPSERKGNHVINKAGEDVTEEFIIGAHKSWEHALKQSEKMGESIEGAILKAKSPSCGAGRIYDGSFSKVLIDGDGCFVRLLKEKGIPVYTEKDVISNIE